MNQGQSKGSLPEPLRRFVEMMQEMNHGVFHDLTIRNGQPVLDPPPRRVVNYRFSKANGPRRERAAGDFTLKAPVLELFQQFDRIGDGVIDSLEVQGGLPYLMRVSDAA